jgi:broad specificity phosphatase PhoE
MLILARHGRTEANAAGELLGRRDPGLDDTGRAQATAIGRSLARTDRVVSSPLRRCVETAEAIGPSVEIDERFIELDYGELEGTPVADVPASVWRDWRADTAWRPPRGETLDELAARVWAGLVDLAEEAATTDIVVVSHVSPIKAAVAWAVGAGIDAQWRCFVDQASISRIATAGGVPSLHSFNETHHLPPIPR